MGLICPQGGTTATSLGAGPYATIHRMIDNPIYGGAYAYGKTYIATGYDGSGVRVNSRRKPRGEWLALMPGAHEAMLTGNGRRRSAGW